MTTTTVITTWTRLMGNHSPAEGIADYAGAFAADFDLDRIEDQWREQIEALLPDGVTLAGTDFIGEYGVTYDLDSLREAIEATDVSAIFESNDLSA